MSKIVIAGTSGVGKSYLERLLVRKYKFVQPPKYTTRKLRPSEKNSSLIFHISEEKYALHKKLGKFGFTLEYDNEYYGWKKEDFNMKDDIVLAITLRDLKRFCALFPDFRPIVLYIDRKDFSLLENRLKKREHYNKLSEKEKFHVEALIKKRLNLAGKDAEDNPYYIQIAKSYGGASFEIKDDSTIPDEVVPFIINVK